LVSNPDAEGAKGTWTLSGNPMTVNELVALTSGETMVLARFKFSVGI
jgi:hypothetical protein